MTDNLDGSFIIKFDDTNRRYYINNDGTVITEDNFIDINNLEELKKFRDDVNGGNTYEGKYIVLTKDINLSENWIPIGSYPDSNTSPGDKTNKPFKGIFDGQNHKISKMKISTTNKVQGFFGLVTGGKITNLGISEDCTVSGGKATAGLCGYLYDGGIISNCYNKSNVFVTFGGGIVGCSNTNCIVLNCYNTGNISRNANDSGVGGIVGMNTGNSTVKNCYNTGNIETEQFSEDDGKLSCTGGIVGYNLDNSMVDSVFNSGKITGFRNVGGVVGKNFDGSILKNAYNKGEITGKEKQIGGVIGHSQRSSLYNTYNIGTITGNGSMSNIGGVCGYLSDSNTLANNYFLNTTISGGNSLSGAEGKTEEELKKLSSTLGENWKNDDNSKNNGYPILIWEEEAWVNRTSGT